MSTHRLDLHDMIRELCDPTVHTEPYYLTLTGKTQFHTTVVPPLLTQLAEATEASGSAESGPHRPAASRPTARLDAIDTLIRIDLAAARWVRDWGEDDPGDTIRCVRLVGSLSVSAGRCHRAGPKRDPISRKVTCCSYHTVAVDVAAWHTWARLLTGWDLPAWQPDNTCPACGVRGSLRVRIIEKIATCINDQCRETWDEATIGLLAEHVRWENREDDDVA